VGLHALISTKALSARLGDERLVVVDCRFELDDPQAGYTAYETTHLPDAVYAHLDDDLAGPITPQSGRHPLPDMASFCQTLGNWGIDENKQVVVYDQNHGAFAARLWWMLRYLGHEAVAVLDGGFAKWVGEGKSTTPGIHTNPATAFSGMPLADWKVSPDAILDNLNTQRWLLIDSRDPMRYAGEEEPLDPVAGHIPGARNHFFKDNLTQQETMLPANVLREKFEALFDGKAPEEVVFYCGSGVSACQNLLAMSHAGLEGARLYVGSWSQWCKDASRPVAQKTA